jgi:nucleoside-diphosphate-sugar epimerase
MSQKSALILGATGKVGFDLARTLISNGWTVHGAARSSNPGRTESAVAAGIDLVAYDVTRDDPAVLPDVDVLFLEIWDPANQEQTWETNFYGVARVGERYAGLAHVVNGCTIGVYGPTAEPATEDTPCRPTSEYGRSRYAQERMIDYFCRKGGKKGIHIRYAHSNSAQFGTIRRFAEAIDQGNSLGSGPDAKIQVIAIEDFVRVTWKSLERISEPPAIVNCCHPEAWTHRALAEAIHRRLGRGEIVFDCESGGHEYSTWADVTRMMDWFGPPQIPVETLIDRVVEDMG